MKKNAVKEKIFESFSGKFAISLLEQNFHSLRTSFVREFKKITARIEPKIIGLFTTACCFYHQKLPIKSGI